LPPVEHIVLRVYAAERPKAVTIFPQDRPADWVYLEGTVTVRLDRVDIHSIVAFDWANGFPASVTG
jgi:hypothetical protein